MNINLNLKDIPAPDVLFKRLRAYSIIDAVMTDGDHSPGGLYHCIANWHRGVTRFTLDDNSGDHYHVLFSQGCAIIKGFDHESELSPYNFTDKKKVDYHIYDHTPPGLLQLLEDPALEKAWVTFCAWQLNTDTAWQAEPMKIPKDWSDGSGLFCDYVAGLEVYTGWFCENYAVDEVNGAVVGSIYSGHEVTPDMITALNFQANIQRVMAEIAAIEKAAVAGFGKTAEAPKRRSQRAKPAVVVDESADLELGLEELKPEIRLEPAMREPLPPVPPKMSAVPGVRPFGEDFVKADIAATPEKLSDLKFYDEPDWIKDVFNK